VKPLESIPIPAFNAQDWIADTLSSALAPTWPRKEIVVVVDGSTDRTLEIARRFESDAVRVVTQAEQTARELGGRLEAPRLSWKYSWIRAICGYRIARRVQLGLPLMRQSLSTSWDKTMFRIERRPLASS